MRLEIRYIGIFVKEEGNEDRESYESLHPRELTSSGVKPINASLHTRRPHLSCAARLRNMTFLCRYGFSFFCTYNYSCRIILQDHGLNEMSQHFSKCFVVLNTFYIIQYCPARKRTPRNSYAFNIGSTIFLSIKTMGIFEIDKTRNTNTL